MKSRISSRASLGGITLSLWPDGDSTDASHGPAPAPASHSLPPAKARQAMTNATCGLRGFLSSPSASLQSSLESRLKRQLVGAGSILFSLTWRAKATPAGRPYSQLVASVRRTSDSDCGSWPTATSRDWKSSASNQRGVNARPLNEVARLINRSFWMTPRARGDAGKHRDDKIWNLEDQARGLTSNGSPAPTEKPGQLNPAFPLWLMGYPPEWESCAGPATRSSRKLPRNSSAPPAETDT